MSFTPLHVHTQYSILDGSCKINELVEQAKNLGMDSLAITDHGVMYGVIDFYKAAKAAKINPIIGCEVYVAPGSRFSREIGENEDRYYHLVLLAENNKGYENLSKIVSAGFVEGFYYKPRVDMDVLKKYHQGIIALSACLAGEIPRNLVRNNYEEAKAAALRYREIFGEGNFFLELQDHGIPEQKLVNNKLLSLSKETGIELVATNDTHYIFADDATAHDILLCIQTGKKVSDENRMRYDGGQYYLKSEEEMRQLFPYAQEAIDNTQKIANRCHVEIEFGKTKLPKYDVPKGFTSWEYLNYLCNKGLEERYPDPDAVYSGMTREELKSRLDYELNTIKTMGFVDYFLIVWDFINYAKENGIPVGPGRGSAAGSIVSYTLAITDIDPIKYNLLFERFLNPERVTMPDIDVDFCVDRRQEVIDYVTRKYGKDRVSQIITFGTMAARGVIRDVGRVLDMPYAQVDAIAKMIPTELNITIDKALDKNPEFKSLYETDEEVHNLIDMCKRLEGLPRNTSMHAAGVVICDKAIEEYVPLSRGSEGNITTQFVMTTIEQLGLLKMDFLGLRNLTVIQNALNLIEKYKNVKVDLGTIDYDDKNVLELIGSGKCEGIFQLESAGMKNFMKELKPQSLEDIIAGISLYRPGPMDFIPKYLKGKNNPEEIVYDCPQLEPILKPTYGCIVYQEQVMQIVRDLGGFSLGRSDNLRRAMSKKKLDVMQSERTAFVEGCKENNIAEDVANKIYDSMVDFAKYAFNKSHAASYAVVSYRTAWLKYYYPVEYMAALMSSVMNDTSKVSEYIFTCRNMGINILPPDINEGESGFSVSGNNIRYGLSAIKSVGMSVIDSIVYERNEHGKYKNLEDFVTRLSGKEVNKRTIENFIKAGALDSFGANRRQLMLVYSLVIDSVNQNKKNAISGQMSLFDMVDEETKSAVEVKMPNVPEFNKDELLNFEKEVLGIYISGHPLEEYTDLLKKNTTNSTKDFLSNSQETQDNMENEADAGKKEDAVKDKQRCVIGGIITSVKQKATKNNTMMAFVTIEDILGSVEVIVFPRDYQRYRKFLYEDAKVLIAGNASMEEDAAAKLICQKIVPFEEVPAKIWLQFSSREEYERRKSEIDDIILRCDGRDFVVIYLKDTKQRNMLKGNMTVKADGALKKIFEEKIGVGNVAITYDRSREL